MKSKILLTALVAFFMFNAGLYAQKAADEKFQEIRIKTSAQCGMCKDRLESALAYEKGVKKSVLNVEDKVLTVTYDERKTGPDAIRQVVVKSGYDADGLPADKAAYDALPACCKKPAGKSCSPGCKH